MLANRRSDTAPELALRSELHVRGLRFRKDHRVDLTDCAVRPDVVFTRARVAVFIDGCFWHRCPLHATDPKANSDYWGPKLRANAARDRRVDDALSAAGWTVVRIWEHEDVIDAADRVCRAFPGAG
jgi:DNA mismatch endonuclease, patch repair protein